MARERLIIAVALALAATHSQPAAVSRTPAAEVQAIEGKVVETAKGWVEFVGLESWSVEDVQKKLGYDTREQLHGCAFDLKKAGFPDAAVFAYPGGNDKVYTVISLVEPQASERVKYRPRPTNRMPAPAEWRDLIRVVEEKAFINGLLDYGRTLKNPPGAEPIMSSSESWWAVLNARRTPSDYREALHRIAADADDHNRAAAVMVLTNFHERDEAWRAVVGALIDPAESVNTAARQAFITLVRYVPRNVDWKSAVDSIRAVLDGTNLFALPSILEGLVKTEVSPSLGADLFRDGGGKMVLAYLAARHDRERSLARDFLVRMAGQDFGFDVQRWSRWMSRRM